MLKRFFAVVAMHQNTHSFLLFSMHRNSRITIVRARSPRNNLYQIILSQISAAPLPPSFFKGEETRKTVKIQPKESYSSPNGMITSPSLHHYHWFIHYFNQCLGFPFIQGNTLTQGKNENDLKNKLIL